MINCDLEIKSTHLYHYLSLAHTNAVVYEPKFVHSIKDTFHLSSGHLLD